MVGAGFAGLLAGWILARERFDVVVLERDDRVGGRVLSYRDTEFVPGRIVEGGAELIGANHKAWLVLAQGFGLGMSVLADDEQVAAMRVHGPVRFDGRNFTEKEAKYADGLFERLAKEIVAASEQVRVPSEPWETEDADKLDAQDVATALGRIADEIFSDPADRALVLQMAAFHLENDDLVPLAQQSWLGLLAVVAGHGGQGYFDDSETFRCASGNDALAHALAADLGDRVRLGEPVERIKPAPGCADVVTADATYRVDNVIFAVPPCAWGQILPASGSDLQMGPGVKYLSPVRDRFWIEDKLAPNARSTALGMTWEATENQSVLRRGGGGRAEPAIVLSVFAGAQAAADARAAPDRQQHYTRLLREVYPRYEPLTDLPPRFMDWPALVMAGAPGGGGYSFPAPNQVTNVQRSLNDGFPDSREGPIWFAGEHCAPDFVGFMEGALRSGARAAERVLGRHGIKLD